MTWRFKENQKKKLPLTDADSAIVPRSGVEEHAMVMQGGRYVEGVEGVENESIVCANFDGRWSTYSQR